MAHTIDLLIDAVEDTELRSYMPTPQYWMLRELLHTVPSSMSAERGGRPKFVVIRIEFRNSSEVPIELQFQNTTCIAELLNLEVRDEAGATIPPVRRMHIRPKADATVPTIVPAKGKHLYDLVGEVIEGWLVFPGAKYQLPYNGKISVYFRSHGSISNTLNLVL